MTLSTEIKFILEGGSPSEIKTHDGKFTPKFLNFLAENGIPY